MRAPAMKFRSPARAQLQAWAVIAMKSLLSVLLLLGIGTRAVAASQSASQGNVNNNAPQRSSILVTTKTHDVRYGTFEAPEDYTFRRTGTIDSFSGTLTRNSDGFTIRFDIGGMSGTHVTRLNQEKFALFRMHTVNGNFAYTGIERINGRQRVATTICDWCERADRVSREFALTRQATPDLSARQAQLNGERPDPANFHAEFTRDEDLVDFMLIVNSYKVKAIPPLPPLIDDGPRAPNGPFVYGEEVDGISLGIRVDSTEYRLNQRIHVWIPLRNTSGRTLTRSDSMFKRGQVFISAPNWGGGIASVGTDMLNSPLDVGLSLHSLMGREMTGTFMVQWMLGGPKPGPTVLGRRQPWKLESSVATFTVVRE